MSIMRYVLLLFCLSACAPAAFQTYSVPQDLETYVDQFRRELEARSVPHTPFLTIQFGKPRGTSAVYAIGSCTIFGDGSSPLVIIEPNYWNVASNNDRMELIFHELGHCWLNLRHNNNLIQGTNYPESVMHSIHFDGKLFADMYEYYVNQMLAQAGYFKGSLTWDTLQTSTVHSNSTKPSTQTQSCF